MVPIGAFARLFSSAGTYPLPFSIVNSILIVTDGSIFRITSSGFKTWNPEINFWKSPAVNCSLPVNEILTRSEEHTSELQSRPHLVCRLLLEKKKKNIKNALRITPSPISSSYSSILHSTNHHISTISTIYPFTRYFINNYIILIFFQ